MGKKKHPKVIDINELRTKNTKELLGYLKKLHKCEESLDLSDRDENEDNFDEATIYFKQSKKWKEAYRNVKSILDAREHINS